MDELFADQSVFVSTQDPIQLDDFSEPKPDLAIIKGTILDYVDHHPRADQVYLVVEVADSTLKQDCEVKDKVSVDRKIIFIQAIIRKIKL